MATPGKEDISGMMCKYCEDNVKEDDANEEGEEAAAKEDNRESDDDADRFPVLLKSTPLSPPLCLDAWRRYSSPFSPWLSLALLTSFVSTPRLLTPTLLEPESLCALRSLTMSYT